MRVSFPEHAPVNQSGRNRPWLRPRWKTDNGICSSGMRRQAAVVVVAVPVGAGLSE